FGPEEEFLRHHGYRLATFSVPDVLGLKDHAVSYTALGRSIMVTPDRVQLIFLGPPMDDERGDLERLRQSIRDAYADVGWETARVLQHLDTTPDLYVDSIGTVRLEAFSRGRVALLGDAAYGGTLGGQGTPLAIVGAYVLAEELLAGDRATAFARYQQLMAPYAREGQKGAERVGSFFAPRTSWGLWLRNQFHRAMTSPLLIGQFEKMVKSTASSFQLPQYGKSPMPPARRSAMTAPRYGDSRQ
ncbi:MAG TPA: FAD-dependent oxidoreductase, partial [Archangium sp.]